MTSSGALRPSAVSRLVHLSSSSAARTASCPSSLPLLPLRPSSLSRPSLECSRQPGRLCAAPPASQHFSTSARLAARKNHDRSKHRGESTIHRSGPRYGLSVSGLGIPEPNLEPGAGQMSRDDVDPNHGLWEFFWDKKLLPTPTEASEHGRAWTVEELRGKSWDDLHCLWWLCVKERNRIATAEVAREKLKIGFGRAEFKERDAEIKRTMKSIKQTLTERFYNWEDAVQAAKKDPEIDLEGKGPLYSPGAYLEDAEADELLEEPHEEKEEFAVEKSAEEPDEPAPEPKSASSSPEVAAEQNTAPTPPPPAAEKSTTRETPRV